MRLILGAAILSFIALAAACADDGAEPQGLIGTELSPSPATEAPEAAATTARPPISRVPQVNCSPAYPDVCIPPPPPDLDCGDISYRRFRVLAPDPHRFDNDGDGIGCESR